MATTDGDEMPCHSAINYEKPDWLTKQYPTAARCVGSLIFLRNSCTLPRSDVLANDLEQINADHETVFSWPHEFVAHHTKFNPNDR